VLGLEGDILSDKPQDRETILMQKSDPPSVTLTAIQKPGTTPLLSSLFISSTVSKIFHRKQRGRSNRNLTDFTAFRLRMWSMDRNMR
jgi:hypothetical protein